MYKKIFSSVPMLRLLVPLLMGIISQKFVSSSFLLLPFSFTFLWFIKYQYNKEKAYKLIYFKGYFIYLIYYLIGIGISYFHYQNKHHNHYSQAKKATYFLIQIADLGTNKTSSIRYTAEVIGYKSNQTKTEKCKGKILVYIKDSLNSKSYEYGQLIWIPSKVIKPPLQSLNPGEFNYKSHLESHQIYGLAYLQTNTYCVVPHLLKNPTQQLIYHIQTYFKSTLHKFINNANAAAVAEALIDGNDDDIEKETIKVYAQTGTLHVLAVSGMHVGLLFWILGLILKTFNRNKILRITKCLITLAILWLYAMLCGLSPSILRATVMFSFITIGVVIRRNSSIYNTLSISAFILILNNPDLISDAGFQLSYAAVVGILFFHPYFKNWFQFKNIYILKIWEFSAVSLAAQVVTFPIGLYYFHQFPICFLFSNLIIIPFTTIILYASILLIILSPISWLAQYLGLFISFLIKGCNGIAQFINEIPYSYIDQLLISKIEVILMYLLLITISAYLISHKTILLKIYLILCIFFFVETGYFHLKNHYQKNITIYFVPKGLAIGINVGYRSILVIDTTDNNSERIIAKTQPNTLLSRIKHQDLLYLKSNWVSIPLPNFDILITGKGNFQKTPKRTSILVLRGYISPYYLRQSMFNKIIINCFLTQTQQHSLKIFCRLKNIELISLKETGAFQLNLNCNE